MGDILANWRAKYSILSTIEMIIPEPSDRADALAMDCVALNSAILQAGLRLLFSRVIRKFHSSWGIALTQLCPNGWRTPIATSILWHQSGNPELTVEQFNSLFTFKENGKDLGWWYTSVRPRTRGFLVLDSPSSIKWWKEEFFYILGDWQFYPAEVDR